MSQYKTHSSFNCLVLPILIGLIVFFFNPEKQYIIYFSFSFLYGTFYMNPDLDIAKKIKLFSLRGVLTIPFRSYSFFFKHRGISHSILLGTITRVAWLFLFVLGVSYLIYQKSINQKDLLHFFKHYQDKLIYIFFGLYVADLCHLFLDKRLFKWKR